MNVGLAGVDERVREFGIRRSYGARSRDIFGHVILESTFASLLGGIVGVALAAALGVFALPALFPAELRIGPAFPLGAAGLGLAVAAVTGLLGGAWPAWRALRISVIDAVRY